MKRTANLALMAIVAIATLAGCQSISSRGNGYATEARVTQVEIGATKERVRHLLGKPDSTDLYKRQSEEVWRYIGLVSSGDEVWISFSLDGLVTAVQQVPAVEINSDLFDMVLP